MEKLKLVGRGGGERRSGIFLVGFASRRVGRMLLIKAKGKTALGLQIECARERRRQTRTSGFEEHEDAFDLFLDKTFVATEPLGFSDFIQMMAIQSNKQRQDARRGNAGGAEVALRNACAFQFEVMSLRLRVGKDREKTAAVISGIFGIGGEGRLDFHGVVRAMAVENKFEEGEAAFVEEQVVSVVADEAAMELVEDGLEQGDRGRGASERRAVELGGDLRLQFLIIRDKTAAFLS